MANDDAVTAIGGYRVERALGAGGMGRVYLCRDESLDRKVAIKILLPDLLAQEEMRTRFLREARALARVSSPNVVAVHAVGEDDVHGPFVVMEYLVGEDLHARLVRDKRIPWREAVISCRDAVAGLKAAEASGIVHRDVKPANLFVTSGRAKLTDFGLARELTTSAGVTAVGIVVGTPAYLAPEVIKGSPASSSSDLYSLGATLYHLVAGHPPFTAEAPLEVIAQAVKDTAPTLAALVPDVPMALSVLVEKMLEKEPARRPANFEAVDAELRALVEMEATSSPVPQRTMQFVSQPAAAAPANVVEPSASSSFSSSITSNSDMPTLDVPMQPSTSSKPTVAPATTKATPYAVPASEVSTSGPIPRIKTASLTVMLTDIAGYTERTSRVSREESARWLALHDQLLQPVFRSFQGKVIKTLGDAFLVTFPSPTDAVHCACAIQDRLFLHNKSVVESGRAEDAIRVRVALSAGEVRLHKGDVFGEPVNLVARLESMAEPGEVLISDAVYSTMNAAEVKLVSRGEHQLKGIARSVVVYAAVPESNGDPNALPFGGRALSRVKESMVDAVVANAPVAMQRAHDVAAPVLSFVQRLPLPVYAGAAGLLFVVVLLVALLHDNRIARIDRGEAKAVIEEIEKVPDTKKSADDYTILGHARMALDEKERAFAAYKKAAEKKHVDDRMKHASLQALAKKDDDGASDVLAAWPEAGIDTDLRGLLASDDWWPRHHAMQILEERKQITDEQKQDVGLHDLASSNCIDRRSGVLLLRKVGKGDDVVDALKKLQADPLNNACLVFDVNGTIDAVKKRGAPK